ncbi:HemK family protein methyltransferase [Candidatus Parcubacteria bacterium]|nr:HemK family protein methyltransferase [Candidatus Parcubacteria bacterium]
MALTRMSDTALPEAYNIGFCPFINTTIWLDSKPLIPRTETEYWVNEVIQEIRKTKFNSLKILDLCAGSGCIGIAVAKELPSAQVDFVELDPAHHETIRKNLRENNIEADRTQIFGGNLFENVSKQYDIIVSNPPYIDMSLKRVAESVLENEPHLALDGGVEGLEIIDAILAEFPKHLKPNGILYLEHEPEQVEHLSKNILYVNSYPDQYGVLRYSKFQKD